MGELGFPKGVSTWCSVIPVKPGILYRPEPPMTANKGEFVISIPFFFTLQRLKILLIHISEGDQSNYRRIGSIPQD
jgi:hypothetical protein